MNVGDTSLSRDPLDICEGVISQPFTHEFVGLLLNLLKPVLLKRETYFGDSILCLIIF